MTLLLSPESLERRRRAAEGPLHPLAASLRRDLEPLLGSAPDIPREKALLSRDGGRCVRDGTQLAFDPFFPRLHRCPACDATYEGTRHDRAWITWYQLWLAERAVHAAALSALVPDERLTTLARAILDGWVERYLEYPNRDNVLGPSRPFFSTYLEAIWLLYLCVALDLLELAGTAGELSSRVRERIIEPSSALIASYDEGGSNRQVWNNAALVAASLLLDDRARAERAIVGRWGVLTHLSTGLLADGSWFEGENYHFFAHRGLWYGVTLARRAGVQLPTALVRRFDEGYATPLATALPDFTFPARRDSQHAISLRQWRFAESCELGLVRTGDPRLVGALYELYERPYPRGDTGRWRSTAEAERNEAATSLTRADLGWRSLLFARPTLPPLEPIAPRSALLEWQGYAVFRRGAGQVYAALDYGHSGGGHGHPDRLNLLLAVGRERWLDDMGTGSYVDPSLHWYRSTLAHNAPLVNGRSQHRTHGVLRAYDERGGAGWSDAEVRTGGIAPGVRVARSLIVMTDYLVDQLVWESEAPVRFELPFHIDGELQGAGAWSSATLDGSADPQDGFPYVRDAECAPAPDDGLVRLCVPGKEGIVAWLVTSADTTWWRAWAPGPPGGGERRFHLARATAASGVITSVWSWSGDVREVERTGDAIVVRRANGEVHTHRRTGLEWDVGMTAGAATSGIALAGMHLAPAPEARSPLPDATPAMRPLAISTALPAPLTFQLGEDHYRRSELSWKEAGKPEAFVSLGVEERELVITVDVRKQPLIFRPAEAPDPMLDNEHPDIHSDGVQIHLWAPGWAEPVAWLAVPEEGSDHVRLRVVDGPAPDATATWRRTRSGYRLFFRVPLASLGELPSIPFVLDVLINDMAPDRQRRRGQLVLSGARGEFVYLRGDRQYADRLLPFVVTGD